VALRPTKPRILIPLRPDANLTQESPLARRQHPAFIYLGGLSSPASRGAMELALERIAELFPFEVGQLNWSRLTYNHVWSIRERLRKRYAPATVNQSLSGLRGVLSVAHEKGLIATKAYQAAVEVPLLRASQRSQEARPTDRQIARLLAAASQDPSPGGIRDRALIGVLVAGGLKRSEVAELRLADFDPKAGKLKVGTRRVALDRAERASLRAWISYRGRGQGPLFQPVNKAGRLARRRMSGQAVAAVVADRVNEARLGALSPEDLRYANLASR
jgi:integrase/recombinase XerD